MIGEAPGVAVGDIPMVDVYTGLYSRNQTTSQQSRGGHLTPTPSSSILTPTSAATKDRRPSSGNSKATEEVVPNEKSQGWKLDAHKNLPGFRELWRRFPDAEWYMMFDDDTYLFLPNLDRFLSQFDANQPYYFGKANVFIGCDGIKKFGDGPFFAHGGSGIVMSRGAMLRFLTKVDKCINKYQTCWAGDIRVGLCLRDAGVLIQTHHAFNGDPPNAKFGWIRDPCE
ncbi:hypothetical protein HK102_006185, partial [Quaeritorhiza haematococci]